MCALFAILVITAAWWALALYPLAADAPAWVARTRAACFGNIDNALPSAGGWLLLIGEPIGMLGTLAIVWGDALREDARLLFARSWGRALLFVVAASLLFGLHTAGKRVTAAIRASRLETFAVGSFGSQPVRLNVAAPALRLTNQRGKAFALSELRGRSAIVTFAFAHCADVCPTVVHQLREARTASGRGDVPIVIVTLDPWRDTPSRLPSIATQWQLDSSDVLLSGSVEQVNTILDEWSIGRSRDLKTGVVSHAPVAYVVGPNGTLIARLDGGFDRIRELLKE